MRPIAFKRPRQTLAGRKRCICIGVAVFSVLAALAITVVVVLQKQPAQAEQRPPGVGSKEITTEYWIFPGEPNCEASNLLTNISVEILKPEYLRVEDGFIDILNEATAGCNGYSERYF